MTENTNNPAANTNKPAPLGLPDATRRKLIKVLLWAFPILIIPMAIINGAGNAWPNVETPEIQAEFTQMVKDYAEEYEDAKNEMKRAAVAKERLEALYGLLKETDPERSLPRFIDWVARLEDTGVKGDKAHAVFTLAHCDITLRTTLPSDAAAIEAGIWEGAFKAAPSSFSNAQGLNAYSKGTVGDTRIETGSDAFNALAEFSKGDVVRIKGCFKAEFMENRMIQMENNASQSMTTPIFLLHL